MTSIEDRIRATLRAHDHQAPSAEDFVPRAPRRSSAPAAIAAVVVIASVVALVVGIRAAQRAHPAGGPPSCPSAVPTTRYWTPAPPDGLEGATRMTPATAPTRAVVCAYRDGSALTGARRLGTAAAATLTADTAALPRDTDRFCDLVPLATDRDTYLIGLAFGRRVEWVSASNDHCVGSSNGQFRSNANLGTAAATTYGTGHWPGLDAESRESCGGSGRLGQDRSLVPDHPIRALVCTAHAAPLELPADYVRSMVDRLRDVHQPAGMMGCTLRSSDLPVYALRFEYRTGPAVSIEVSPGCDPQVTGGALVAPDAGPLVGALLSALATGPSRTTCPRAVYAVTLGGQTTALSDCAGTLVPAPAPLAAHVGETILMTGPATWTGTPSSVLRRHGDQFVVRSAGRASIFGRTTGCSGSDHEHHASCRVVTVDAFD